jgi:large subunit ribosomal protein L4
MKAPLYNIQGQETGSITLPEKFFGVQWNADLVHQVAISMRSNERTPVAHTKTRGEVSGTGKKPWQQKGTGRARHGSRRSPLWVGGGVAHGPRNDKNYERKINKKMRLKALFTILSRKAKDGEILFVDSLSFAAPKTKEAKNVLVTLSGIQGFSTLATKRKNAAIIAVPKKTEAITKSFSNIGSVEVADVLSLNPLSVLNTKYIVLCGGEAAVKTLTERGSAANSK